MRLAAVAVALVLVWLAGWTMPSLAADAQAVARGAYLFAAADCASCHTDAKNHGAPLAGGAPIITAFGTFYAPNITPDRRDGIGDWSEADFHRALRDGIGRDGEYLYPVLPFTSFTHLSDDEIADLYAFLMTQKPVAQPDKRDAIRFPFNIRPLLAAWRWLYFRPGPLQPVAGQGAEWNRGRHLAEAVVHCQECHTPRNFMGALEYDRAYAGNPDAPDHQHVPDITSDAATGIGKWSLGDIVDLLATGVTPDGDAVGSGMAQVVDGTEMLTSADRHAIAVYIKSLPPLRATGK